MTTKIVIVNCGPDPVLVRSVDYGIGHKEAGVEPRVLDDRLIAVHGHEKFWVHKHQQLLVGEKRAEIGESSVLQHNGDRDAPP